MKCRPYIEHEDDILEIVDAAMKECTGIRYVRYPVYAALLDHHNSLVKAVRRMMKADSPGVWNAKDYMEARAEADRLLATADCEVFK